MQFTGLLYRALNPIWAREPLSGDGAKHFGGRFNCKGRPTLYTSLNISTAIRESNQIGTLQPITLVSYVADIVPIFDATDNLTLAKFDLTLEALAAENWRLHMQAKGQAVTQIFSERLVDMGFAGMKVHSFARGAGSDDLNIILWQWGPKLPTRLQLNDDEGRLQ